MLKSFWRSDAPLENTLFVLLDPQGRPLTRGVRSPAMFFRDASEMASAMNEIASRFQPVGEERGLPVVSTVRLGVNVAACDKLPLVIVVSDNPEERRSMKQTLAPLSWSNEFVGKLTYTAGGINDLKSIQGVATSRGYLFVSPDQFGTSGTVVAQLPENASLPQLRNAMEQAIDQYHPNNLDHHDHVHLGRMQGIHWQSAIPITDPHAIQAEQMGPPRGRPPGFPGDMGGPPPIGGP